MQRGYAATGNLALEPARRVRLATFFAVYTVLGLVLPLWVLLPLPEPYAFDPARLLAEIITQYCAVRLSLLAARGEPRFPAFTFFIFVYVWCGMAASAELTKGHFPWLVVHHADDSFAAALMIATAILSYEGGRWLTRRKPRQAQRLRLEFQISKRVVYTVCVAAPLLFAVGLFMIHDVGALFGTRAHFDLVVSRLDKTPRLIATSLLRSPPFAAFMLTAYYSLTRWRSLSRADKRAMLFWMMFLAALNGCANFPGALFRAWLSAVVLTPLFALIPWRRWLAPAWILALSLSAIVVFPYLDAFRNAKTFEEGLDALSAPANVVDPMLYKGDYDAFQQTANAVVYVDRYGIDWGNNLLGAALFWVPRKYWPSKSGGTSFEVNYKLGYSFTNLSVPLWMEAYVAFGWLGVIFILGGYGYASARGEQAYMQAQADSSTVRLAGLLVPFWGAYQFFIMRGDLQNVVAFSSVSMVLFLAATRPRLRAVAPQLRSRRV